MLQYHTALTANFACDPEYQLDDTDNADDLYLACLASSQRQWIADMKNT